MKTLALVAWATLGCSIDWSLARRPTPADASGGTGGAGGTTSVESV